MWSAAAQVSNNSFRGILPVAHTTDANSLNSTLSGEDEDKNRSRCRRVNFLRADFEEDQMAGWCVSASISLDIVLDLEVGVVALVGNDVDLFGIENAESASIRDR